MLRYSKILLYCPPQERPPLLNAYSSYDVIFEIHFDSIILLHFVYCPPRERPHFVYCPPHERPALL
jgi:hypothetical protein